MSAEHKAELIRQVKQWIKEGRFTPPLRAPSNPEYTSSDAADALLYAATAYCWRCFKLLPPSRRRRYWARCESDECRRHFLKSSLVDI